MRSGRAIGAALLLGLVAMPLHAGQREVRAGRDPPAPAVDLARIEAALRAGDAIRTDGLRVTEYFEVNGRAPTMDLFGEFDLESSAVRYGSPTHAEMVAMMTPRNFRVRGADLTGVVDRLARRLRRRR